MARRQARAIDVVGARRDGVIDLGECKWGPVSSPGGLLDELERKALAFPNPKNATLLRRVFVREGRSSRAGAAKWYDLERLFELGLAAAKT